MQDETQPKKQFKPLPPILFSFEILLVECAVVVGVFILLVTVGYAGRLVNKDAWKLSGEVVGGAVVFNFDPAMNGYSSVVIRSEQTGDVAFNTGWLDVGTKTFTWSGYPANYKAFIYYNGKQVSNYVKFKL